MSYGLSVHEHRNSALLLMGFAGAFRRRWAQVVAAYDPAGRPWVIRLLRTTPAFENHVCRGGLPQIRKNVNLSDRPLLSVPGRCPSRHHRQSDGPEKA